VRKNGGTIRNRRDHLVCYQLEPTQFRVRRALIVNQFGRRPSPSRDELALPSFS